MATIIKSKLRRVTQNGKTYLVAPLSLLVEGVLNGSKGPLFYPSEEILKTYQTWDNIPIVLEHPTDNSGGPLSASHPSVWPKAGLGRIRNPQVKGDKLKGEGWFDEERLLKIAPNIHTAILNGEKIEVSTGLFTDNVEEQGNHRGIEYNSVARNHRPDHLAILQTTIGACSVNDGCGVFNSKKKKPTTNQKGVRSMAMSKEKRKSIVDDLVANCSCGGTKMFTESDREVLNAKKDEDLMTMAQCSAKMKDMEKNAKAPDKKKKEVEEPSEDVEMNKKTPVKNQSEEEWFKSAPPNVQNMIKRYAKAEAERKESLIKKITANSRNKFSAEQLAKKDEEELSLIASLAGEDTSGSGIDWSGAGYTPMTRNQSNDDLEVLERPTLDSVK